jgi:predicted nucleic acid-binding Zn ribbon protein
MEYTTVVTDSFSPRRECTGRRVAMLNINIKRVKTPNMMMMMMIMMMMIIIIINQYFYAPILCRLKLLLRKYIIFNFSSLKNRTKNEFIQTYLLPILRNLP